MVCLLGALLAVAFPTFIRTVQTSKIAEASSELASLYKASASYYATAQSLPDGTHAFCLATAAGPAPALPAVEPVRVDFSAADTPGAATWSAIGFLPQAALRYRYSYLPTQAGCALPTPKVAALSLRAEGDLDGDGAYSRFERGANLGAPGELVPDPVLRVRDRVE